LQCGFDDVLGTNMKLVVAYGGGVNSTAMLIEFYNQNITPDLILFADTGGERPDVYAAVARVSDWCAAVGFPRIVTVHEPGPTLEEDCLTRNALPALAYGFKSCSDRWKRRPQERYLKTWLSKGERYRKAIGFDIGERRRSRESDDPRCENWFPLIEWELWREDCERICQDAQLPVAKSSCFFCPSMKRQEVIQLSKCQLNIPKLPPTVSQSGHFNISLCI